MLTHEKRETLSELRDLYGFTLYGPDPIYTYHITLSSVIPRYTCEYIHIVPVYVPMICQPNGCLPPRRGGVTPPRIWGAVSRKISTTAPPSAHTDTRLCAPPHWGGAPRPPHRGGRHEQHTSRLNISCLARSTLFPSHPTLWQWRRCSRTPPPPRRSQTFSYARVCGARRSDAAMRSDIARPNLLAAAAASFFNL